MNSECRVGCRIPADMRQWLIELARSETATGALRVSTASDAIRLCIRIAQAARRDPFQWKKLRDAARAMEAKPCS